MNIEVTRDNVTILEQSETPHENEYKITTCYFTFDEFTSSFQVKRAIFTVLSTEEMYETDIINNQCDIPSEVLVHEYETVKLGVYGYNIGENEELLNRFSPSYAEFIVPTGSYKEGALSPEPITPTQYDLYSQALQEGLQEVDDKLDEVVDTVDSKLEEVDEKIEEVDNLNIEAEKVDKITTIEITYKDGTSKTVTLEDGQDGVSLENIKIENKNLIVTYGGNDDNLGQVAPSIEVGTTTTGLPSTNASVVNVGTDLNPILNFTIPRGEPGAIKMLIVNELPTIGEEDTIYLVPLENPDVQGNNYAEYIYINGNWELLGKIGVQVDLTDYVCFDDWANYNVPGVVKIGKNYIDMDSNGYLMANTSNYDDYANIGNYSFIGKGTLENVITGKGLVSNTDYATNSRGGVIKGGNNLGVTASGTPACITSDYNSYQSASTYLFISKGTLENVITGKDLTTKAYVDGLVGDINTALDILNGEVI